MPPYLVLLQVGFSMPQPVTQRAVRSYRTISPLPAYMRTPAVSFLLHFPSAHAAQELPGTSPYGARTFLGTLTLVTRLPSRLVEQCSAFMQIRCALLHMLALKRNAVPAC